MSYLGSGVYTRADSVAIDPKGSVADPARRAGLGRRDNCEGKGVLSPKR